jgi:GH18 family chitinase
MMGRRGRVWGLAVLAILSASVARAEPRVVAYVPNWIDLAAFAKTIDFGKVTHLNLAFENPTNAEGDLSFHAADEALIAAAHAHGVKILLSIGGGSASENKAMRARYFELLAAPRRASFVAKLATYLAHHHFDGIDVDLEGSAINADFGAFVGELRAALQPKGLLLTAALSRGYGGAKVPNAVLGQLDFVNLMAYDGAGPWEPKAPGQHSSMEFASADVEYWLKRGLPKAKLVLGVPFYGYGFGADFRKGSYGYNEILKFHLGAENADQVGATIWYNGQATIRAKARYAVEQGLGGIMIWSLDYDVAGSRSLLTTIFDTLHALP